MINVTVCIYSTHTLMGIYLNENIFHFQKYRLILVLVLIYNSNIWFLLNYILLTCCTDLYCMSNSRSKQLLYLLYNCCQIRPTHSQISNLLSNTISNPSNEIIRTAAINLVWKHELLLQSPVLKEMVNPLCHTFSSKKWNMLLQHCCMY